jgi:hypothetical protein
MLRGNQARHGSGLSRLKIIERLRHPRKVRFLNRVLRSSAIRAK